MFFDVNSVFGIKIEINIWQSLKTTVQKMLGVSGATAMRLLQKLDSVLEPLGHGR